MKEDNWKIKREYMYKYWKHTNYNSRESLDNFLGKKIPCFPISYLRFSDYVLSLYTKA